MSDFQAPSGPPPPKVPEGWKAVWNDQYKEWFYVNLHTKQSTWEKPTEPAPHPDEQAVAGAPPSYSSGPTAEVSDTKRPLESNNPYNGHGTQGTTGPSGSHETDEEYARRLQNEENQRSGTQDSYYGQQGSNPPGLQGSYPGAPATSPQPDSSSGGKSKGFLGKLLSKASGGSSHGSGFPRPGGGYPHMPQGYGGYPQQGGYGGYPQHGYGGYPQPGYGPGPGYGGGYGYGQPQRKRGGGMGAGGAAALGLGGGLIGGALLADAMNDGQQEAYADGYDDGQDGGDFDGGGE